VQAVPVLPQHERATADGGVTEPITEQGRERIVRLRRSEIFPETGARGRAGEVDAAVIRGDEQGPGIEAAFATCGF
jgi:hypothetical protein